jgi:hypothetical protein
MEKTAGVANPGELPASYHFGQELDWDAPASPVTLHVELPFWLFVANTTVSVACGARVFDIDIRDDWEELHWGYVSTTRYHLVHIGPEGFEPPPVMREKFDSAGGIVSRPCKTVLRVRSSCNSDVLGAILEGRSSANAARSYLRDYCAAHVRVVNELIRGYRMVTYDPFAYEISPWDVPFWLVDIGGISESVMIVPYLDTDRKPNVHDADGSVHPHNLMEPSDLTPALALRPFPGELDLLDAENLMVRGDYSGAVRRIATALEVALEAALRQELQKTRSPEDVERELARNERSFYARLEQLQRLAGRELHPELWLVLSPDPPMSRG